MKPYALFAFCILHASTALADDIVVNAKCSPVIGSNIGQVYINCSGLSPGQEKKIDSIFNDMEALREYLSSIQQLESLIYKADKAEKIASNTLATNLDNNSNRIQNLEMTVDSLQSTFNKTWEQHAKYRDNLNDALASFQEKIDIEWEVKSQYLIDRSLRTMDQSLHNDFNDRILKIEKRIASLEREVAALKTNVSYLMEQYLSGNYPENISFFGISFGTLNIDNEWYSKYSIGYEILLPEMPLSRAKGAFFAEISGVDWKKSLPVSTLPGLGEQTYTEDNTVNYAGLGLKYFVTNIAPRYHIYAGAVAGESFNSEEDTSYYGFLLGSEYHRQGVRILFELRYDNFTNISETSVEFDPFGATSAITTRESIDGFYLGTNFLFR